MTRTANPGDPVTFVLEDAPPGQLGILAFRLHDPITGLDAVARSTVGITYQLGSYYVTVEAPLYQATFTPIWDDTVTFVTDDELLYVSSTLGNLLCSLADVKLALGFEADSTNKDDEITDLLPTATRLLEAYAKRNFANPTTATKRLTIRGGFLALPDLQADADYTVTRVTDTYLMVEETDYFFDTPGGDEYGLYTWASTNISPYSNAVRVWPASHNRRRVLVDVTGTFGFPAVPELAKRAAVTAIGAWISKGVAAMRGNDVGQGAPVSPVATWSLPWSAKDIISDLCIKTTA